jgi:hypothetical protein
VLEGRCLPSTVTNLNDAGSGSLRDAIATTPSGGTVDFQDGLSGTIVLATGELAITKDLTIAGPGADVITVNGNHVSRVFNIGAFTVAISGMSIVDGQPANGNGGGILSAGVLTVTDSTLSGNSTNGDGGGIFGGTVSVTNCNIGSNHATFGGGAIYGGSMTVSGCIFSGNSTVPGLGSGGGAIYMSGGGGTVSNSTFVGNLSEQGGGIINNSGTLMVSGSSFSQNHAGVGGGIFNVFGTGTVTNSTFSDNFADTAPVAHSGGAIANSANATLTIAGCTLSGNSAGTMDIFGVGGGISNVSSSRLTLTDSTLYGNSANRGGGIWNEDDTLAVTNCTLSGNSASVDGGGIWNSGGLNSRNTIIAGNKASNAPDLVGNLGSQGYNLIGTTLGGSGFDSTDLLNVDPLLGPLQDNGGPTQTMALLAGSPALNAGDPAELGVPDQRGVVRSGGVNIGAYQASASAFVLTAPDTVSAGMAFDVTVQAVDPFGQVALGYTGTVTFSTSDPDPGVVLPADYTFTPDDQGTHTFSGGFTLITPGDQTLRATDTADNTITGGATVTVTDGGGGLAPAGSTSSRGAVVASRADLRSLDRFFTHLEEGPSCWDWRIVEAWMRSWPTSPRANVPCEAS